MRISLEWLKAYVDVSVEPEELANLLTMAGLEVSGVERLGEGLEDVVVAEISEKSPHPNADRLSLCRVTDGRETYEIVCGAANMEAGDRVALARVDSTLPGGLKIKKARIRGQTSYGMMCSERELGLGDDHSGILILPLEAPTGQRLVELLGLPRATLDVELTPNRPDCLSVVGVAREVAALTGGTLRIPEPKLAERGSPIGEQTSVEILAPDLCHRYAARIVRGVRLGPSPLWMRQRLQAGGVRAINNVVDVTNYVLLELGHPLHAFDLHRLEGERIVVARAREGDVFTTLDGQERALTSETLMICDAVQPVALAGIMGGLNSEVQEDTVDVLLESAYFLPENIRRTSKRLGLRTEASYRFERGTDIEGLMRALDRATELIAELAGGEIAPGVWDAFPTRHETIRVGLRCSKVTSLLGLEIPEDAVVGRLQSLGLKILNRSEGRIEVEIPPHRVDLTREVDLIEEVARLEGYDAIPVTLPEVPMVCEPLPREMRVSDVAREALSAAGMREAVTLSFIDPAEDDRLGFLVDSPLRQKVMLENPLSQETAVMRTSLLPGLLRAAGLNVRRQARDVRLFEVGRTFHPAVGQRLPTEILRAGGIVMGRRYPLAWWDRGDRVDFYDIKGIVEDLLAGLSVSGARFESALDKSWLHPGRSADVKLGDQELGWLGQIHPDRLEPYEISSEAFAFEVDLGALAARASGPREFPGLGRFPSVERDVALLVDRTVQTQRILDEIASFESPLIRSAVLFDIFEGGRMPAGKMSAGVRITYRSDERTLTESEVMEVEQALLRHLDERVAARLRDT